MVNAEQQNNQVPQHHAVMQQRIRTAHMQAIEEAKPFADLIWQVRMCERPKYVLCDGVLSLLDDGLSKQQRAIIRQCEEWITEIHKRAFESVSA